MKAKTTQQEILLITGSKFTSRMYCPKDDNSSQDNLTELEKLQEACWNGMIQDMLPEICDKSSKKKLFLWNVVETDAFLELKLGSAPGEMQEKHLSIDPYLFLSSKFLS